MFCRPIRLVAHVVLLVACLSGNTAAQLGDLFPGYAAEESATIQETVKVIRGLKDRQFFDLAQRVAAEQLASGDVTRIDRGTIVIEQVRNWMAQAIDGSGEQRRIAWQSATMAADDFLKADPDHPRRILIETQIALTHLAHGSLIQQEIAAELVAAAGKQDALEQFRLSTAKFREIENEIDRRLPIQRSRTLNAGDLNPEQLMMLKNNIRYQRARVNLSRAELYDSQDRLNRIDALNQVLARLDEVLSQSNPQMPIWWRAQVSRARCYRLMGNTDQAAEVFGGLPEIEMTSELRAELLTERLLLAAAAASSTAETTAVPLLTAAEQFEHPPAPLQMAQLRLLTVLAGSQGSTSENQWTSRAAKLVDGIEANHGDYWGRRAEIMLVGSVKVPTDKATVNASDYEILVRQGDAAFRKQNYADAVRAYEKAVAFAEANDDPEQTVALTVRLSRCHELMQQHRPAAERLLAVAQRYAASEGAAAIYLRGCWNEAQQVADDPTEKLEYLQHLQTLVETWPESASADQARLWQGYHFQAGQDWPAALQSYLGISRQSPLLLQAMPYIQSATDRLCRDGQTESGDVPGAVEDLVSRLVNRLDLETSPKPDWTEAEQQLLLVLIRCSLVSGRIEPAKLLEWLNAALAQAGDSDASWTQLARGWKLILLAVQSESPHALQARLKELPNQADLMQTCFAGLSEHVPVTRQKTYAAVMEMICSKALIDGSLTAEQRAEWQTRQAVAQTRAGNVEAASRNLQELASRYPDSLTIQLELARVLSQSAPNAATSMDQWRRLAGRLKPGTESWFEAKYSIAQLLADNDRAAEAKRLLEYVQATQLQWKSSSWAERIESLLKKLNQAGS